MSKESGPYVLASDDSGHEYVIPKARSQHWEAWLGSDDWMDGVAPDWAERIDGTFEILDYKL